MHIKLISWFQDRRTRLRGKSEKRGKAHDGPKPPESKPLVSPFTTRSRPLTPITSCTDLKASFSAATASSAFFQHLPPEIRRKILVMAFGDRTLHMSLEFNYPRRKIRSSDKRKTRRHLTAKDECPPQRLYLDDQAPMEWQWRGCPCWRLSHSRYDDCVPGVARCWKHASDVPDMCLIGAMGWLLTCRQAYSEGIDVLYSTNMLNLSNQNSVIIHHLQDMLSPRHLAMITSIELDLGLLNIMRPESNNFHPTRCPRDAGQSGFLALLDTIPKALPNLLTVFMDINGFLFHELELEQRPPFYDQHLFEPIDDMVRKLGPQLQTFVLSAPYTISRKMMSRARVEGSELKTINGLDANYSNGRSWRPLPTLDINVINGQTEGVREEKPTVGGYWIVDGIFDDPYPLMGCFCSGSVDPERHDAVNVELDSWTDKDKTRPKKTTVAPSQI